MASYKTKDHTMKSKLFFILFFTSITSFAAETLVDYYQGPTTCDWALEVKTLNDANVFAIFSYTKNGETVKYVGYFNPSDSRGARIIVALTDNSMESVINRPFTYIEKMGLQLAAGFVSDMYDKLFGISQIYVAGNNSHEFNKATGKTTLGKANEPNMLHAHIIARGNPNLPIGDSELSGPEAGFTFDMRGQTPTEKGNERKEKWNGNKMDSMKSLVQKEIGKMIDTNQTWELSIETAVDSNKL